LIGINKIQFHAAAGKFLHGFVLIHRLERRIMGDGPVSEGQPEGMRNSYTRLFAFYHLRGEQKLLDLLFAEVGIGRLVWKGPTKGGGKANQYSQYQGSATNTSHTHTVPLCFFAVDLTRIPA